jgi:hypothetical protein
VYGPVLVCRPGCLGGLYGDRLYSVHLNGKRSSDHGTPVLSNDPDGGGRLCPFGVYSLEGGNADQHSFGRHYVWFPTHAVLYSQAGLIPKSPLTGSRRNFRAFYTS